MKKLERIKQLILKYKYDISKLCKHGFKYRYTDSMSGGIWVNSKLGIVVKRPYIKRYHNSHPKFAIPTLEFRTPKDFIYSRSRVRIFIQPLAKRTRLDKAFVRLSDMGVCAVKSDYSDFRRDNIGWYRNRPVLIDW